MLAADDDYVPQVVIDGNGTGGDDTADDLVPWQGYTTNTIYLANPIGQDVTVILNNSSGNLTFSGGDASNHLTLTLPGDGDEVSFTVYGQSRTTNYGTAVINAHDTFVNQPVIGSLNMTVYSFGDAKISLAKGAGYNLVLTHQTNPNVVLPDYDTTNGAAAVGINARIALKPSGVSLNAPQIQNYRVGIVQNVSDLDVKCVSSSPFVSYVSNGATSLNVPKTSTYEGSLVGKYVDIIPSTGPYSPPLYDSRSAAVVSPGQTATSSDRPGLDLTGADVDPFFAVKNGSTELGAYSYNAALITYKGSFSDYPVLFNTQTQETQAFRRINWTANLSSANPGQTISANLDDVAYDGSMKTDGTPAIDAIAPSWQHSSTTVNITP